MCFLNVKETGESFLDLGGCLKDANPDMIVNWASQGPW